MSSTIFRKADSKQELDCMENEDLHLIILPKACQSGIGFHTTIEPSENLVPLVAPGIFRWGAGSYDQGAKIRFSGYDKCQKSPKICFSPSVGGLACSDRRYSPYPSPGATNAFCKISRSSFSYLFLQTCHHHHPG